LVHSLKICMFQQSRASGKLPQDLFLIEVHSVACSHNGEKACRPVTRGIRALLRRACVLWRDGATRPPVRSLFSFVYENRASWNDDDGWVETCASALNYGAPTKKLLCKANEKYKGIHASCAIAGSQNLSSTHFISETRVDA
jgi:hypothetical protein